MVLFGGGEIMAGFYETLMAYQNNRPNYSLPETRAVFGNAATTPGIVAISDSNINALRDNVNQARNNLMAAQQGYNNLAANRPQQYINDKNRWFYDDYDYRNNKELETQAYQDWQNQLSSQQANINNAQSALSKYQTDLQDAVNRQRNQIMAGQDAVNWGLTAKNAEAQGLQNAMQAYQQLMANAGTRNAIMNAAIGTVGNSGGGQ